MEVRIVFKNFGAWSFKSDSGLGQRSVRLQRRESGGPGLGVLVWKACAVYITGELGDRTGRRGALTTLYSAVTVFYSSQVQPECERSPKWGQSDGSLGSG